MRLPAYPLITVDPFFSIWSKRENLYDSDTELWCGIKKRLTGILTIDKVRYTFLGKSQAEPIQQVEQKITPFTTSYVFENELVRLTVCFWTPLILEDLNVFSLPCSFIDYEIKILDSKEHRISVSLSADEEFAYDRRHKKCEISICNEGEISYIKLGRKRQNPLSKSGDAVSADWGYVCLCGGSLKMQNDRRRTITSSHTMKGADSLNTFDIIAFDDIYSVEYFGNKLRGLWSEKFKSIGAALHFCMENRQLLLEKLIRQEQQIIDDARPFGDSYVKIITAASRQILAAHKLVRSKNGELLYLSKECNSNGCINTVDVSYPAVPFFLLYKPELVKAMLTGIFEFSNTSLWQANYAPHDIGRYPHANGQVYALKSRFNKRSVYKQDDFSIYDEKYQMPVEECGNMLILSYAYYFVTGDKNQLENNFDSLLGWCKYLVSKGIALDNQLCTDDFAGHSTHNINLAIKSIIAIACFSKISEALNIDNSYMKTAREFADSLCKNASKSGYLPFSLDCTDSWSMKYNLVWDIVFGFNLFENELYDAESRKYLDEINEYGVPLDYRKNFTKTDWMLWSACLDKSKKNIEIFSKCIVKYLENTHDRNCFTDWYDTVHASECGFNHRSVQGGLWMPVLKKRFSDN